MIIFSLINDYSVSGSVNSVKLCNRVNTCSECDLAPDHLKLAHQHDIIIYDSTYSTEYSYEM